MNHCSLSPFLWLLGKKWSTHIMATFCMKGVLSFWDIRREFPHVTATTISSRLTEFQNFDLIEKDSTWKYSPTQKLYDVSKLLEQIETWTQIV